MLVVVVAVAAVGGIIIFFFACFSWVSLPSAFTSDASLASIKISFEMSAGRRGGEWARASGLAGVV